ncbi:MAG: thioredoxin family protein [Labilithrix sp.]|nr:thioredoxin family protein [Labilithrix sp.]MCW5813650.1 thioredoxin family protein [Labilithrix sp.]
MALALSEPCPEFALPGTDDRTHDLGSFGAHDLLVVAVSCNHCPYVVAYEERMIALAKEYGAKNVGWLAVNANDATRYPDDGMQPMKIRARERGFPFPYVRDDSQAFVRALGARFTPEMFVFDRERKLRYHGRIDDNHRDPSQVTSQDLRNALDALLAGNDPPAPETTAFGCSVKWK